MEDAATAVHEVSVESGRGLEGKTCFIIMPFGVKQSRSGEAIDFDAVYTTLIAPAVRHLGLVCTRSDEVSQSGLIHKDMIERILESDLAIVDVTTGNPNVLYELGVRHTARKSGTIILRREQDSLPFNINGMRAIDYPADLSQAESVSYFRDLLETNIANALTDRGVDSLVHTLISGLSVIRHSAPISERRVTRFERAGAAGAARRIGIVTGDMSHIDRIDAWVNPENTKMQMGRFHDDNVSALIRYHGAKRDRSGIVREDIIAEALKRAMRGNTVVEPATVIATPSGELRRSNNVRAILHVAAQHGEPGRGYVTIRGFRDCVTNVFDEIDRINASGALRARYGGTIRSVLSPLFGVRGGLESDPQDVTQALVLTAIEYFEKWPDSAIEEVYFSAYTKIDRELLETSFRRLGLVPVQQDWTAPG